MLITSNVVKGRCPICGAVDCTCGGPSTVVAVDERVMLAAAGGAMLRFDLGRGVSIKLREETARRRGLLPAKPEEAPGKKRPVAANKMRRVGGNK